VIHQNVEFVITQDTLHTARFNEALNEIDNCGAVWSTVGQVTHEDKSAALGMPPIAIVAKVVHQRAQGPDLTVDIANDVEWTVEEGLYE